MVEEGRRGRGEEGEEGAGRVFCMARAWTRGLVYSAGGPEEVRLPLVFRIQRFRSLSRIVGGGTSEIILEEK